MKRDCFHVRIWWFWLVLEDLIKDVESDNSLAMN